MVRLARDGRTWRIGTDAEVAWIAAGTAYQSGLPTSMSRTITGAVPPVFEAYAAVLVAYGEERDGHANRPHEWEFGVQRATPNSHPRGLGVGRGSDRLVMRGPGVFRCAPDRAVKRREVPTRA